MSQFNLGNIQLEDQSVVAASGGGEFKSLIHTPEAVGPALLRFVGYIETGLEAKQQGEGTDDKVQLIFDVVSPRHTKSGEKDGVPYSIVERISVYLKKGSNAKSGFMNFFTAMNYGKDKTHFAQMLGEAFLADLFPKTKTDGSPDPKGRNVIHDGWNGKYTIRAPRMQDPVTGAVTEIEVPAAKSDLRCFLWNTPTQEMWDSLNIADKDDNDEKNFFKAQIKKAVNYAGSPVQALVEGTGSIAAAAAPAPVAETPAPAADAADPLAALGV